VPIVASRGREIQRLLDDLAEPRKRTGAIIRLRSLGARVVPHAAEELGRLNTQAREALLEALRDVDSADARALRRRLARATPAPVSDQATEGRVPPRLSGASKHANTGTMDAEGRALDEFRRLPAARPSERASISRARGEAHLALARAGSRLARQDLLQNLHTLSADRTRLYCEAAGLIGDGAFLAPLARLVHARPEAAEAIARIALRERITGRSKILRDLEQPLRVVVARALTGH
jgi:hypothetical protein